MDKKIGFVTPWYGEKIPGGAEAELRGLVHHLHDAGLKLEVLTTCVKSFLDDWDINFHNPGETIENGVLVRRFLIDKRNRHLFDEVNLKLMKSIPINEEEEKIFCKEMINSSDLYDYIKEHGEEYSVFVFIPYMFGTTYYGCQIFPEKSVLIPCFHDESYAYLKCFREKFSKVRGMCFNSEPERELAERLYGVGGKNFVTFGIGMETDWSSDAKRFCTKYNIVDPFILYAGRKEEGKRVDVLIRYFSIYKDRNPGNEKLVLIGGGKINIPKRDDIIDLGFVSVQDKYDAYSAATVFCNPSQMESFSIVIMESWLAGTPVLVNGKCEVTRDFVHKSNGGLYYENYYEFEECMKYFLSNQSISNRMGKNGNQYVKNNFSWDVIVKRYQSFFMS